eukprot:5212014-Pyramimonas_sp.AAC.1
MCVLVLRIRFVRAHARCPDNAFPAGACRSRLVALMKAREGPEAAPIWPQKGPKTGTQAPVALLKARCVQCAGGADEGDECRC